MKKMMTANELEMINGGVVERNKPHKIIVVTRPVPGPTIPWPDGLPKPDMIVPYPFFDNKPLA